MFQIVHKSNTLPDLLKYYNAESAKLPLLHHSIFLNKVCNVARREIQTEMSDKTQEALSMAERVVNKCVTHLFENVTELDSHSMLQLLKVLAFQGEAVKLKLSAS